MKAASFQLAETSKPVMVRPLNALPSWVDYTQSVVPQLPSTRLSRRSRHARSRQIVKISMEIRVTRHQPPTILKVPRSETLVNPGVGRHTNVEIG
jgi:hypothetical protein